MNLSRKRIAALGWLAALFASGVILLVSLGHLSTPGALKRDTSWAIGGTYLGTDGVVLQNRRNNCGPAALKMIFDHYGVHCDLSEIERTVGLTSIGSSLLALKQMAEIRGLRSEGWSLTPDDVLSIPLPAMLFVHGNHYVVIDSMTAEGDIFVRDPAIGRLRIKKEVLPGIWNGETLVFWKSEHAVRGR